MLNNLELRHRYQESSIDQLVVTLHGYGSNMDDLHSLKTDLKQFGHVLSLNAPYQLPWGGFAWFELEFEPNGHIRIKDQNQIVSSLVLLKKEISNALELLTIDPKKLILIGFSQGAMMSYEYVMNIESHITAACLLSGRQGVSSVPKNRATPIIQTHGTLDEVINVENARLLKNVIAENFEEASYFEYENMGHGISPECWKTVIDELQRVTN